MLPSSEPGVCPSRVTACKDNLLLKGKPNQVTAAFTSNHKILEVIMFFEQRRCLPLFLQSQVSPGCFAQCSHSSTSQGGAKVASKTPISDSTELPVPSLRMHRPAGDRKTPSCQWPDCDCTSRSAYLNLSQPDQRIITARTRNFSKSKNSLTLPCGTPPELTTTTRAPSCTCERLCLLCDFCTG